MKKKLIILDFDDTLTDNSERDLESFQNIAEIFHLDSIDRQDILNWRKKNLTSEFIIKKLINSNDEKLLKNCFNHRLKFLEKESYYTKYVKLKPLTVKILQKLKNDGYTLALNSIKENHQNFLNTLHDFQIQNYFENITSQKLLLSDDSFESRSKTKKLMYEKILSELAFKKKENILIIGNLFSDIIPGNDLGIESVMIEGSFGFDTSYNYSCDKISKLEEIYKFI
tara:strand:- start:764 stop:1441 length:678 start_codon:yes stop_codon:yes gene_type:complete